MAERMMTFCDVCNPDQIVYPPLGETDGGLDRWVMGNAQEARDEAGWMITEDGKHVCPKCQGAVRAAMEATQ